MAKGLSFSADNAGVPETKLDEISEKLKPAIKDVEETIENNDYEDVRASVNLPSDFDCQKRIKEVAEEKDADFIVVCGIGGSNLGTIAVEEAVRGRYSNDFNDKEIYFADTVDPASVGDVLELTERAIDDDKNVLVNVVTKSGGTTETIANAEVFLDLLKDKNLDLKEHVVFTTTEGNNLWKISQENGIDCLSIPENVGGRYSVLSSVGLFPLHALGIDIDGLVEGAKDMRTRCIRSFENNPAARSAATLYYHNNNGVNIHDSFFFNTDLESVGKWYRQLTAESLGKEGKGITPNVSIGSTDLHSMVQLYLGGPDDKFTTFITVGEDRRELEVPNLEMPLEDLSNVEGRSYAEIREAIFRGTVEAYKKREKPFIHVELADKSAYSIGQFLQLKMIEIMYLGRLLEVNAFNQPNVEEYKEETRRILED